MDNTLLWIIVSVLAVFFLIPFLIGFFIAPSQQSTRVELIKAPLDQVWASLSEPTLQAQWRADLKGVQLKDEGDGLHWVEQPLHGARLTLRKIKQVEQQELLLQVERNGKVKGTRQAVLRAVPGGTRVTFTESVEISNPFSRFIAHINSRLDKRLNHYINQLKNHFKEA